MALPATRIQLELKTYDDLRAMPDDGHRYELINGEIVMSPSPRTKHQRLIVQLTGLLNEHVRGLRLGEIFCAPLDVRFSHHNVVQPDIFFVKHATWEIVTEDYVDGVPDLIVEILSPSNRSQDLVRKAALYADHGVPEYWIVDPEGESVVVSVWQNGLYSAMQPEGDVLRSSVFPELRISTSDIFALPDWLRPKNGE